MLNPLARCSWAVARVVALAVGLICAAGPRAGESIALAEPAQLTPAQQERLDEAKKLDAQDDALYDQGKIREALTLAQRALAIRQEVLGEKHPETANSLNNVGFLFRAVGDLTAARPYLEQALAIRKDVLGLKHADTADSLYDLGSLLEDQNNYAAARPLLEQALAIRFEVLGEKHRVTAQSLNKLGLLFQAQRDYAAARPYYERALAIYKEVSGEKHLHTATLLNNLGSLLDDQGDYEAAKPCFEEALAIRKQALGEKHPDTAASLNKLGLVLRNLRNYSAARPFLEQALTIRLEILGEKHRDTVNSLNELGLLLQDLGDYAAAQPYFERSLAISKEVYGERQEGTAAALHNLGSLLQAQGDYTAARPYCEQAVAIRRQVLGEKHASTAVSLDSLGRCLQSLGEYSAARCHLEQAVAIYREVSGARHVNTAASLGNLGSLLCDQGEFVAARACHDEALSICRQVVGERHPDTATALHNFGILLLRQGDYAAARPYYERALAIYREVLGEKHPNTAASLYALGLLLKTQGDFAAARTYFEQALAIFQEAPGGKVSQATVLNILGSLSRAQGDYAAARPYFERALAMTKEALGELHPHTAPVLNNLGLLLQEQGDYAAARPCFEQALAIFKKAHGEFHPETAIALNNLGLVLQDQGEYAAARPLLEQALKIDRQIYGEAHPDTAVAMNNVGLLLSSLGERAAAWDLSQQAARIHRDASEAVYAVVSEAEALNFAAANEFFRNLLISIWLESDRPPGELYAHLWTTRGTLLRLAIDRRQAWNNLTDPAAQAASHQWLAVRAELARLLLVPAEANAQHLQARRSRLEALSQQKEGLERRLAELVPEFARQQALTRRPPQELARQLPTGHVLLDLVRYLRIRQDPEMPGPAGRSRVAHYAAFLVAPGEPIRFADLGPAEPIDRAVSAWRGTIAHDASTSAAAAGEVRRLVWQPLENLLPADARAVYLVPDAALASLPWSAIPGRRPGHFLLEEYTLTLVPSGSFLLDQLTRPPREAATADSVLAVGGVRYDERPAPPATATASMLATRAATVDMAKRVTWPYLAGTLGELKQVETLAGGRRVVSLTGAQASPALVLQALSHARWAVLSTHGFFADPKFRSALQLDEGAFDERVSLGARERTRGASRNPLVLSGLVLAGANLPRPTDAFGMQQGDDGILTAESIAGRNLDQLELAVLSACETGLGDVAGGEGVFGLQRAFHVAGCRNIVASLWKVDDAATLALMSEFHKNLWQKRLPPANALRQAQLNMLAHYEPQAGKLRAGFDDQPVDEQVLAQARKKLKTGEQLLPPFYWAAFVLSGVGD